MTSPLRKKRPTTARITPAESTHKTDGHGPTCPMDQPRGFVVNGVANCELPLTLRLARWLDRIPQAKRVLTVGCSATLICASLVSSASAQQSDWSPEPFVSSSDVRPLSQAASETRARVRSGEHRARVNQVSGGNRTTNSADSESARHNNSANVSRAASRQTDPSNQPVQRWRRSSYATEVNHRQSASSDPNQFNAPNQAPGSWASSRIPVANRTTTSELATNDWGKLRNRPVSHDSAHVNPSSSQTVVADFHSQSNAQQPRSRVYAAQFTRPVNQIENPSAPPTSSPSQLPTPDSGLQVPPRTQPFDLRNPAESTLQPPPTDDLFNPPPSAPADNIPEQIQPPSNGIEELQPPAPDTFNGDRFERDQTELTLPEGVVDDRSRVDSSDSELPEPAPNPFETAGEVADDIDDAAGFDTDDNRFGSADDRTPKEDFEEDCNEVRQRALATSVSDIDLDLSPKFGVGPRDRTRVEELRQRFVDSAQIRQWYDYTGQFLVDGRFVDLSRDDAIVETTSGARQRIALSDLSDSDIVYVSEKWGLPTTCSLGVQPAPNREFLDSQMAWHASGLCHNPLYFEEVQLERYGHEIGPVLQPVVSSAHFFANIAVLPYKMGIHPPNECQYALGYYRPGSCAPWTIGPIPISLRGALFQAGGVGAALAPF